MNVRERAFDKSYRRFIIVGIATQVVFPQDVRRIHKDRYKISGPKFRERLPQLSLRRKTSRCLNLWQNKHPLKATIMVAGHFIGRKGIKRG